MKPSIHPSLRYAEYAQDCYNERVKSSLCSLLESYVFATHDATWSKSCLIDSIHRLKRSTPELYFLHDRLQQAMRNQNVADATTYVHRIADRANEFEASFPYLSIDTALKRNDHWEEFARGEAMLMTERDFGRKSVFMRVSERALSEHIAHVATALSQIAMAFPEMHAEFSVHVRCIRLFDGAVTMGFTDERMFGAMLLRIPVSHIEPVSYYIEHIVHEASHIHLNALMAVGKIILNDPGERFVSPIRPDPRPMLGVFHATYVTSRIVQALLKLLRWTKNENLLPSLAEAADELIRGYLEISRYGTFTEYGASLIRELRDQIAGLTLLPEWRDFDFDTPRQHRYGSWKSNVAKLKEQLESAQPA